MHMHPPRILVSFEARSVALFTALTLSAAASAQVPNTARPRAAASGSAITAPAAATRNHSVRDVFARVDQNGDGELNRQEAQGLPALVARFDELDANHNGQLSRQEVGL